METDGLAIAKDALRRSLATRLLGPRRHFVSIETSVGEFELRPADVVELLQSFADDDDEIVRRARADDAARRQAGERAAPRARGRGGRARPSPRC